MESSDILDCAVRVKEESIDTSIIENDRETIDEKPDLKNFHLLPFQRENSDHIIRKCDVNRENKLGDEVEIIVECEDVKPNINLLTVEKTDDDSQNHYRNIKNSDGSETQNNIKIETTGEAKQEFSGDVAADLDLNLDCALVKQNKKRRITNKLNDKDNLKTKIRKVHNDKAHACKICGRKYSSKGNLKYHIDTAHNGVIHSCDICGKKLSNKSNLKTHFDTVHSGDKHACDTCGNEYASKNSLNRHVLSAHRSTTFPCDFCGKKFSLTSNLKIHVDAVHNGIRHACNICGKTLSQKNHLKIHKDSVHDGVKHTCDKCGKSFSQKCSLKTHINTVHNGITHACDRCGKKFSRKCNLNWHVKSACNVCEETSQKPH